MPTLEEKQHAFSVFLDCLRVATHNIQNDYFILPVHGSPDRIYRERVYCYELFHQLRVAMGDDFGYSLGGEVDKRAHPIMKHYEGLANTIPDLLVHQPGNMDGNLIIIEVKSIQVKLFSRENEYNELGERKFSAIEKDLRKLTAFTGENGQYFRGIYIVYGSDVEKFNAIREEAIFLQDNFAQGYIDLNRIDLFWHQSPQSEIVAQRWT